MAKWEVPTLEEREVIRQNGRNPDQCAVSHPGEDQLIILDWKDHRIIEREVYVRLPPKK